MRLQWLKQPKGMTPEWKSACGLYSVWLQGRPRHDAPMWAAQYMNEKPWLCSVAPSVGSAKAACQEHLDKQSSGPTR